jgi:hypothetical protein
MDFARLGAQKAATPSLCARVGGKAFFLCCGSRVGSGGGADAGLREEGGALGGSGLHVLAPGVGCLCQGHDGDVLAQVRRRRRMDEWIDGWMDGWMVGCLGHMIYTQWWLLPIYLPTDSTHPISPQPP